MAQTPAHNPVPPLQWTRINPTGGNSPPSLAYASLGFDNTNNQLVIFGGETSGGLLNSNTYLFDLGTMSWTTPTPSTNQNVKPPARSRALSGHDTMASYRNGLVVYGGMGQQGALDDIWEYVFNGQFWYQIPISPSSSGSPPPSSRFSAIGGGDPPSISNADTNLRTTFWLAGGLTGSLNNATNAGYDDIWRLQIEGTIAANIQNPTGTWTKVSTVQSGESIGFRYGEAGLIMRTNEGQARLGLFGGCNSTAETSPSYACATQDAHALNTADGDSMDWSSISACPSARLGAVLVPNYNGAFQNQAFLLLGLSPNTDSTDVYDLDRRGEIDVLSIDQGVWTRILPSCDPSSNPPCPIPREGAAVVSSAGVMAGSVSASSSDIVVFGGKDKDGNVLSDIWLLRASSAQITHSNQTDWGGQYGSGQLIGGVNNHGQGVTVEFLDQCAAAAPNGSGSSSSSPPSPTSSNDSPSRIAVPKYTTSAAHKSLAAISVLAILGSVLFSRATYPSHSAQLKYAVAGVACAAWALGAAGFATSFSSIQETGASSLSKRAADGIGFAATPHAIIGVILFALAYILAPLLILLRTRGRSASAKRQRTDMQEEMRSIDHSALHRDGKSSPGEKDSLHRHGHAASLSSVAPTPSEQLLNVHSSPHSGTQSQTQSFVQADDEDDGEPMGAGKRMKLRDRSFAPTAFIKEQLWRSGWGSRRQRLPSQASPPVPEPEQESPPTETGFVVLNRGKHALDRRTPTPGDRPTLGGQNRPVSLSDVSWLERRRNLGMVGDLDYAMSQMRSHPHLQSHQDYPPDRAHTPLTHFSQASQSPPQHSTLPIMNRRKISKFPPLKTILFRVGAQALLLALWVYTAVALFSKGGNLGTPLGAVFIVLVVGYYVGLLFLAVRGKPADSILVVIISRLRGTHDVSNEDHEGAGVGLGIGGEQRHAVERSPMVESATLMSSRASRAFPHPDVPDDDEDDAEDIEREMGRREVSIVTVPKRRLFIANANASSEVQ